MKGWLFWRSSKSQPQIPILHHFFDYFQQKSVQDLLPHLSLLPRSKDQGDVVKDASGPITSLKRVFFRWNCPEGGEDQSKSSGVWPVRTNTPLKLIFPLEVWLSGRRVFSRRNRTSFLFSISVNFSVLTKSLRSGEKKGFLALYIQIHFFRVLASTPCMRFVVMCGPVRSSLTIAAFCGFNPGRGLNFAGLGGDLRSQLPMRSSLAGSCSRGFPRVKPAVIGRFERQHHFEPQPRWVEGLKVDNLGENFVYAS